MRISKRQLKQIIKEEIQAILQEDNADKFDQLILNANPGDTLTFTVLQDFDPPGAGEYCSGETYNAKVLGGNKVEMQGSTSCPGFKLAMSMPKEEAINKLKAGKGSKKLCDVIDCTASTGTVSGVTKTFAEWLTTQAEVAPSPTPEPTPTPVPTPTPEPSVGCKSDAECKSKCGNIPSCKCIKMNVGPGQCIHTGGYIRPPRPEEKPAGGSLPEDIVLRYGSGYGSKGKADQKPDVKKLQTRLVKLKHMSATRTNRHGKTVSSIDGFYGAETKKAVVAFQRSKKGLEVDGVAGENTLKALNAPVSSRPLNLPPIRT